MPNKFIESNVEMESLSPCSNCKNKFDNEPGCRAFEDIPIDILLGKNNHKKLFPGQETNILFEAN
jgi:hypothetical protein